ncbi:Hypothetical Protein FCC1311_063962 [Hondaea fermentalgiana]|uniref:Uncharacterized protein n=1 Tax=Hondaea fermentalgiana TaxID=2315210 RepID=A0A2R5GGZ2_9STRA|nr:Hypothetical Protein FCC1311_063962 [Hondaea fermentalgiana]|eukprot:GBG30176.1 Hypothetical Protein FCC1311_063962 [Hondaea fermentalgiana]
MAPIRANSTRVVAGHPYACATPPPQGTYEEDAEGRKMKQQSLSPTLKQAQAQSQTQYTPKTDEMTRKEMEKEKTAAPQPPKFVVGDVVHVESRTWPGINKPGGVGKITRCNMDGSFAISYVLGGSEKRVHPQYMHSSADILFQAQRPVKERDFYADYQQQPARRRPEEDGASVASGDSASTLRTVLSRKGSTSPKRVRIISSNPPAHGTPSPKAYRPTTPTRRQQQHHDAAQSQSQAQARAPKLSTKMAPKAQQKPAPTELTVPSTPPHVQSASSDVRAAYRASTPPPPSMRTKEQHQKQAHATPPRPGAAAPSPDTPTSTTGSVVSQQQEKKEVAVPRRDPPKRKLETSPSRSSSPVLSTANHDLDSKKKKIKVAKKQQEQQQQQVSKVETERPLKQARTTESLKQIRSARHEPPQTVEKVVEQVVRDASRDSLTRDSTVLGPRRVRSTTARGGPASLVAQIQLQNMERMDLARKFEVEHSQTHKVLVDALHQQSSRDNATSKTRLEELCLRVNRFWRPIVPAGTLDPRIRKQLYLHTSNNFRRLRNKMLERQAMEASILRSKQIRELVALGYELTREHIEQYDMCPLVKVEYKYGRD